MKRFEGKVALVTGATNGIGRAAAVRLASEGALVAVNKRPTGDASTTLREIKEAGGEGFEIVADMSEPQQIIDMVQEVAAARRPHRLPGVERGDQPVHAVERDDLRAVGPALQHQPAGDLDCDDRDGKADDRRGPRRGHRVRQLHLGARRGAFPDRLLRHQRRASRCSPRRSEASSGSHGIRVNCVEPGAVLTNMSAPMMDEPDILKYYVDRIALHRIGDPSEMAGVIAFLLSEDASYVTAATLAGGRRLHRQRRALDAASAARTPTTKEGRADDTQLEQARQPARNAGRR